MNIAGVNVNSATVAKAAIATCAVVHIAGTAMLTAGAPINVNESMQSGEALHRGKRFIPAQGSGPSCNDPVQQSKHGIWAFLGVFGMVASYLSSSC